MKVSLTAHDYRRSWMVSLAFWLTLIVAGGLYACVALSPKLTKYLRIQADFHATQIELVGLEREVQYLDRVASALERPDFSEELARVDFDAARPGDERIRVNPIGSPVDRDALDAGVPEDSVVRPSVSLPWYMPLVEMMATDQKLRRGLLISAAVIVLLAFTFLQDGHHGTSRGATSRSTASGTAASGTAGSAPESRLRRPGLLSQLRHALVMRYGRSR